MDGYYGLPIKDPPQGVNGPQMLKTSHCSSTNLLTDLGFSLSHQNSIWNTEYRKGVNV